MSALSMLNLNPAASKWIVRLPIKEEEAKAVIVVVVNKTMPTQEELDKRALHEAISKAMGKRSNEE